MSLTGKKWKLYKPEGDLSRTLSAEAKISPITAQILINRGINAAADVDGFMNPKLSLLFDPADIPGMKKATERVKLARERGEKICVYGDYDVDGVTGTSILLLALKKLGMDASYYIPHRYDEGYGLNNEAISKIDSQGVKLIITVDCGISNNAEVDYANSLGIDVVITDHHNVPNKIPLAHAIVNPKLMDAGHRSRDLSGAGVAFKFAWGLYRSFGISESGGLISLLDLAGLGTIADVVPLIDENRVLAVFGLKSLNEKKRSGIRAIADVARIKKKISAESVNFAISPRINAAGRLDHASLSVELLTSDDENRVRELAGMLDKINIKRQGIGDQILKDVLSKIDGNKLPKMLVLEGDGWHAGVIGIVASKIVDRFYRPAVLIGVNGDTGRGSARSIDGLDMYEVLDKCRDLFVDFGGHKKAAGFEINTADIPAFIKRVSGLVDKRIKSDDLIPELIIDAAIDPGQINMSLAMELDSLGPFGEGNESPTLLTSNLKLLELRRVGDGSHLKARFTDGRVTLEAIGFGLGELAEKMKYGAGYDIVYNLGVNEYNGFESAQLNLMDIRDYNSE